MVCLQYAASQAFAVDLYAAVTSPAQNNPAQSNPDLHCTVYEQHVNIRCVTFSFGKSRVDPGSSTTMPCICLLPMLAPDYSHQSTLTRSLRLSMPRPQVRLLPINGSGSYRVLLDCGLGIALAESLLGSEIGLSDIEVGLFGTEPQSHTVVAVIRFGALTAVIPK